MRLGLSIGVALLAFAAAACVWEPDTIRSELEIRRTAQGVEVERSWAGREIAWIDVEVVGDTIVMDATFETSTATYEMVVTGPGIPVTGTAWAGGEELELRNGRAVLDDGSRLSLADWKDHNAIHEIITGGPLAENMAQVAPYREAIEARLAEAAPLFEVVALFQKWRNGFVPPWPALGDPRDLDPPGHLPGDVIGLGMTCSPEIRCPNAAPFCTMVDAQAELGFCTRACATDDHCAVGGGRGRCALTVVDVPGTPHPVRSCRVDCAARACPGLLACNLSESICLPAP